MNAAGLKPGDVFVECSTGEWETLTQAERKALKRVKYDRLLGVCRTSPGRIHFKTSAGDWCIPAESPVHILADVSARAVRRDAA